MWLEFSECYWWMHQQTRTMQNYPTYKSLSWINVSLKRHEIKTRKRLYNIIVERNNTQRDWNAYNRIYS